ncbi:hypothetical protein [Blastococcus capsensis]|uniref:hypothetical protein n=1 Tax=Blastococcus capsensis TaxID=1564163 RepID=UPI002540FE6D|nr:hypothetical protein [Blastococcus capsensis]MDK3257091.1 hypothetical protein [Blastococcus capsensis]
MGTSPAMAGRAGTQRSAPSGARGRGRRAAAAGLGGVAAVLLVAGCTGPSGPPAGEPPDAAPESSARAPGTTATPGLPGLLTGIMPEAHGHLGPSIDGNGNLYTVVEDFPDDGDNEPKAMRSTDGGATWSEIDREGRPSAGDLEADWLVQVGTRIWFGYQKSNGSVFVSAFGTSDDRIDPDTWSVAEKVHETEIEPEDQWVSLAARGDGDLWVLYATDPTSRQPYRIGVRPFSAATGDAGDEFLLDPDRTVSQAVAVAGAGGVTHVFYKDHAERQVFYRSLAADGTLGPSVRVDTDGAHRVRAPLTNPVVHRVDGAEVVTVAWADESGVLQAASVEDGRVTGAPRQVSDVPIVIDPADTTNRGAVAHLAADGSTVHAVYADEAAQDVWYDVLTDEAGWGTDAEVADGLETQWLPGLLVLPDRGGAPVLGYLYDTGPHGDDSGIIRYDEHLPGR